MDTSKKVVLSPRTSYKRTSSFGVQDPSHDSHFPALPGGASVAPAVAERELTRMSSSFKEKLTTGESANQEGPAEIATKPLQTIKETADSPRISAARTTLPPAPPASTSSTGGQAEPPQRVPSCDEEGFRVATSRKSRTPQSTNDSPAVASQTKSKGFVSQNPFAVLGETDAETSFSSRALSGNLENGQAQAVDQKDFPFTTLANSWFDEEESSLVEKTERPGPSDQDARKEEIVTPAARSLVGRAIGGVKNVVSVVTRNPTTSVLVTLGVYVGARLLLSRSRRSRFL